MPFNHFGTVASKALSGYNISAFPEPKPTSYRKVLATIKEMPSSATNSFSATKKSSSEAMASNVSYRNIEVLVYWNILDFFSFTEKYEGKYFDSPAFTYSGCSWCLRLYTGDDNTSGCISLYLQCTDSITSDRNIAFAFGLKKSDGTLEETPMKDYTFKKGLSIFGKKNLWCRDDLLSRKSEILLLESLTITCRLKDIMFQNKEVALERMKLMELETLSSQFRDLFNSTLNHDVTIKAKDKEFEAHRAVLMARSQVFPAMFNHDLSEKETGIIDIEDSDPESFGNFLQYLYTGMIEGISFRNAYHLYITAHKYDVKQLKSFCVTYMEQNLTVENFCDVTIMADQYDETSLMGSAQVYFNRNACSILSTAEWETLMKKHFRLANRLFKEMASTVQKE